MQSAFNERRAGNVTKNKSEIAQLLNLGPTSEKWLNAVGIYTKGALKKLGPVKAYLRVKKGGYKPSLNLLYALAGTLMDVRWNKLPQNVKTQLLLDMDSI